MPLHSILVAQVIPPVPPIPDGPIIVHAGGAPLPPEAAVVMMIAVCVTIVVLAIGIPLARAWARRQDRRAMQATGGDATEVLTRLDRIEHALDAMSIEVERIAEGQRFANKMFAERGREPLPLKAPGDR